MLTDGTLRFKRKWGARLVHREASNHLLLHWKHLDRFVARALSGTALVFLDHGYLSAVGSPEGEGTATSRSVDRAHRLLKAPGLHRLYLCSSSGFEPGTRAPGHTRLVDLGQHDGASLPRSLALHSLRETAG
jgi:hypothetical protein